MVYLQALHHWRWCLLQGQRNWLQLWGFLEFQETGGCCLGGLHLGIEAIRQFFISALLSCAKAEPAKSSRPVSIKVNRFIVGYVVYDRNAANAVCKICTVFFQTDPGWSHRGVPVSASIEIFSRQAVH